MNQTLSGTETSLISAYSFNGSITDLNTTNANNLTANAGAVATNADSPFGTQADGAISSTLDYGIITKVATTTVTVQVPEGNTIPTSGGVSAVSYSTQKAPYGMPIDTGRWRVESIYKSDSSQSTPTQNVWYNELTDRVSIPIGQWLAGYKGTYRLREAAGTTVEGEATLSTSTSAETDNRFTLSAALITSATGPNEIHMPMFVKEPLTVLAQANYSLIYRTTTAAVNGTGFKGIAGATIIYAECAYL
jgi:hypothetical protein